MVVSSYIFLASFSNFHIVAQLLCNICPMRHPLRYESRAADSGSQDTEHNFSYTEIRNQRHRIRSGEGTPFVSAQGESGMQLNNQTVVNKS